MNGFFASIKEKEVLIIEGILNVRVITLLSVNGVKKITISNQILLYSFQLAGKGS